MGGNGMNEVGIQGVKAERQGMEEDLGRRGIADITGNGGSNGDADAIMEGKSPDV
ncbi:hypothetical protein GcM1_182016 [Golovinomyces cichoracearum]|uniref:Uncharacterized protein n=1 Tax=Golovinomyces cichoracearum TaxID=62708 RepID=A0A420J409_9PEZI|nr:hypothetical protein GcM1_182016 [Golovinomyces cichoracearum]